MKSERRDPFNCPVNYGRLLPPSCSLLSPPAMGTAATSPCHPAGWLGERAATPEPVEPIKNACERGKGHVQEGRELVTSPYIIPQAFPVCAESWECSGIYGRCALLWWGKIRRPWLRAWETGRDFLAVVCKDGLYAAGVSVALDK